MAYLNEPMDFGGPANFGPQVQMPQPKKKAGMFGAGKANIGEILSAALNGYLAARGNPVGMAGLQMLHQRRNDAAAQQQAAQDRENQFQDFVRREAWQIANKPQQARENDTVADYNFWQSVLSPQEFNEWKANKIAPPQIVNMPGVGIVQIPRSGAPQMGAPAPQGVTFTPLDEGGPTPPASGNFPRAF